MKAVWRFNQADHLPPNNQGVCLTLVAFWMQQMRDSKSEVNRIGDAQMEELCRREAQRLQKFYEKVELDQDEAVTWSLRQFRLESNYRTCSSTTNVVRAMADKRTGYSMGIYFTSGGGHALGLWRSGRSSGFLSSLSGHSYFFDPNVGCFKGNTGGLAAWLEHFLAREYPDYERNNIEIAKVVPAAVARAHWGGARKMI